MAEQLDFSGFINLANDRIGAEVVFASDDFFAEKENLVKSTEAIFIVDKYTDRGKWMDGWESRRKRTPGHDWCVLKLGRPGFLKGFDIDTSHFLGNHPPFAAIEAGVFEALTEADLEVDAPGWETVLEKSPLDPGSHNLYKAVDSGKQYTHIKLHIYPDGGVARLKVFGEIKLTNEQLQSTEAINLAAAENGAKCISCSDMFFSNMNNLLLPGRGINMGDGWETKRNRTPGNIDWVVLKLAHKGELESAVVDTRHFKGNFPESCSLEACVCESDVPGEGQVWEEILTRQKLSADQEHTFELKKTVATHLRLKIHPDGGVSRLRIWGRIKI